MRNIVFGLDIGSRSIKGVLAGKKEGEGGLKILAAAEVPSEGMRRGMVARKERVSGKIKEMVREVSRLSGIPVKSAYVAFGSSALGFHKSRGRVAVSRADGEVSPVEIERVLKQARPQTQALLNREVLDTYGLNYVVDSDISTKDPSGIKGENLEVEALFITALQKPLKEMIEAVEEAGLAVEDIIPAPLAAARALLSKRQREVGAAVLDIGAETTSLAIFEDDLPYSLSVQAVGSNHITNDIALGFQMPLQEAERIKLTADFPEDSNHAKRKFVDIVEARLEDMFESVQTHLKKVGRAGLLPGGVVIAGGGARLGGIADFAKDSLKLPAEAGKCLEVDQGHKLKDPLWAVAVGLCLTALDEERIGKIRGRQSPLKQKLVSWFKSLIP
ncbi:MAG: cell division protein FtsA [Patescibacteria group bacterium]